jgi:hypothetical protein
VLPVGAQFLAAVRGSHQIVSRVRVLNPVGQTGTNLTGTTLDLIDGQVVLDASADIRGSLDVSVAELWPATNTIADLVPYGTEVAVDRGVQVGNGVIVRAPLGIYVLTDVEQDDAPKGALRLTGKDRMQRIQESDLEAPVNFVPSTTIASVFNTLITDPVVGALPTAVISWADADNAELGPITARSASLTVGETERYAFLDNIVAAMGKIWYFDYRGILVIKSVPSTATPVWTANAGPNGVLVSAQRGLTRKDVYNAVVCIGEGLDDLGPVMSVARDTDPNSVTFWGGPFGKLPYRLVSQTFTNAAQCQAAALAKLALLRGLPMQVDFTQIPNPALEPLDPVTLVYPVDLRTQPNRKIENHVLQAVTIGLGSSQGMDCKTKLTTNYGVRG